MKILVVRRPHGTQPNERLEVLIGCKLIAHSMPLQHGAKKGGRAVRKDQIVAALKEKDPEAAEWWKNHLSGYGIELHPQDFEEVR